jgi:hypothetical protein
MTGMRRALLFSATALIAAGCGLGDDRSQLVGTWRVVATRASQFRMPGSYEVTAYRFNEDGSFVATETHLIRVGHTFAPAATDLRGTFTYHRRSEHLAELELESAAGRGTIGMYVTNDTFDISDERYARVRGSAQGRALHGS